MSTELTPEGGREYYWQRYVMDRLTVSDLADEMGVARVTASKRLHEHGIEPGKAVQYIALRDETYLRELYDGTHESIDEIAEQVGCSKQTVRKWFRKHGIELPASRWEPDLGDSTRDLDVDEIVRLYSEQELTLQEVADEISCGEETVRLRLAERGVERRTAGNRPGPDHPNWKGGHVDYYGESWHRQRQVALDRDDNECRACGMGADEHRDRFDQDLHVHHITPFREFDDHERVNHVENLVTLCRACHARWEGVPVVPEVA